MISNIPKSNNQIFSNFPKYNLIGINTVDKNNQIAKTSLIKRKEKKKKILFGSTLASTIITTGIFAMIFAKGPHGSSLKKLGRYSEKLTEKLIDLNPGKINTALKKGIFYTRKGTKKIFQGLEAISNVTALKDWFANKLLRKTKITSKFADKSKEKFKKIVNKTLGKKYDKAEVKIKDMASLLKHYQIKDLNSLSEAEKLKKIKIKDKTLTLGEWINELANQAEILEKTFDKNFSLGARKLRDKKRTSLLSGVSESIRERFFKDKKSLFNLSNYKTYVTEDVTMEAQKELEKDILKAKCEVTNNIQSIYENLRQRVTNFSQNIKPEDEAVQGLTQIIKQQLDEFKACSGQNEAELREKVSKNILETAENLKELISNNSGYSSMEQKEMLAYIKSISKLIKSTGDSSKGALEEIMTILNGLNKKQKGIKLISNSDYKEFQKIAKQINKSLDKAVAAEKGEYFLKQAELEVGSAPTDILSILLPIGAGGYAIASGEDREERVSKTLTTCIPLIGTFATFVYGTTKMLSGAKNLAFTLISGAVLSKLGSYADKLYKNYKNSGSIANVVKDEYNHFVSDITPEDFKEKK